LRAQSARLTKGLTLKVCRIRYSRLLLVFAAVIIFMACGKKAPPRWVEEVPPGPPVNLQAELRPDMVKLGWTAPEDNAVDYLIAVSADDGPFKKVAITKGTSYTVLADTRGISDKSFKNKRVRVTSRGEGRIKGGFAEVSLPVSALELPTPASLTVSVEHEGIRLKWSVPSGAHFSGGFNVYRSKDPDTFSPEPLNNSVLYALEFMDNSQALDNAYYQVRAVLSRTGMTGGQVTALGPGSEVVSVSLDQMVPQAPKGFGAAESGGRAVLYWDESPEVWAREYLVYRLATKDSEPQEIGTSRTPAFTDKSPDSEGAWYGVRAVGPGGPGPMSGPVSAAQR